MRLMRVADKRSQYIHCLYGFVFFGLSHDEHLFTFLLYIYNESRNTVLSRHTPRTTLQHSGRAFLQGLAVVQFGQSSSIHDGPVQ